MERSDYAASDKTAGQQTTRASPKGLLMEMWAQRFRSVYAIFHYVSGASEEAETAVSVYSDRGFRT
jgi:hypothetical protein